MWQKPSSCKADSPMCVNVRGLDSEYIEVRNSRCPHTITSFDREEWQKFVEGVKLGEFDLKSYNDADAEEQMEQV